jgi:hypothetical protein
MSCGHLRERCQDLYDDRPDNSTFKIDSTEQWLHAMDANTYPHPQAPGIRPQYRTIDCVNYYRNRKDS